MYSVFIDYGKYEFVVDAQGQLVTVKRNGEYWQVAHNDWVFIDYGKYEFVVDAQGQLVTVKK